MGTKKAQTTGLPQLHRSKRLGALRSITVFVIQLKFRRQPEHTANQNTSVTVLHIMKLKQPVWSTCAEARDPSHLVQIIFLQLCKRWPRLRGTWFSTYCTVQSVPLWCCQTFKIASASGCCESQTLAQVQNSQVKASCNIQVTAKYSRWAIEKIFKTASRPYRQLLQFYIICMYTGIVTGQYPCCNILRYLGKLSGIWV